MKQQRSNLINWRTNMKLVHNLLKLGIATESVILLVNLNFYSFVNYSEIASIIKVAFSNSK